MSDLDPAGLAAARRFTRWHIGDPYWANHILNAYNNPEESNAMLDKEQA